MYYEVIYQGKIIEVLEGLDFVKQSPHSKMIVSCLQSDASGIISEDGKSIWHVKGYLPFKDLEYPTVSIQKTTKEKYHQWKALNGRTPEEIIDEYTLSLIEGGLL